MFTSPHLVEMTERIKVNGTDISKEEFVACYHDVMKIVGEEKRDVHPSFFEFLFLMAMDFFGKKGVDIILLETGLGGRLDATNCIKQKDLCIITRIGLDHTEYLGDTISLIAGEKAGIIKEGVPVAFLDDEGDASKVIKSVCDNQNSKYYPFNVKNAEITRAGKQGIDFSLGCSYYRIRGLGLETSALYQVENASLSLIGAHVLLGDELSEEAAKEGLKTARWPARMEMILPDVYLDGAHNIDGTGAFIDSVGNILKASQTVSSNDGKGHRLLLFGAVKDKDYDGMIGRLADSGFFDTVFVSKLESARSLEVRDLKETFIRHGVNDVMCFDDVKEAFDAALSKKAKGDILFIAGSLYLAGQIRDILNNR